MVSTVLIESDWNLKYVKRTTVAGKTVGINRIRLEFKVAGTEFKVNNRECINRIRLEFKGGQHPRHCPNRPARINRIRLEFKAGKAVNINDDDACINRIRLEFKAYQLKS